MFVSMRRKAEGRSGDGRECKLSHKANPEAAGAPGKIGRVVGEGAQALAWSTTTFSKSPAGSTSVSTSPETDPGTELFPFFQEDEQEMSASVDHKDRKLAEEVREGGKELDYQNPLFNMPLQSDPEKEAALATASIFPSGDTPRAAVSGSNPMFSIKERPEGAPPPRPRPKQKKEKRNGESDAQGGQAIANNNGTSSEKKSTPKEKKSKAMYEHVGCIDVRPSERPEGNTLVNKGKDRINGKEQEEQNRGFRLDSFARNEGDDGEIAHFKFVFSPEPAPGVNAHQVRPVLDVVHHRHTRSVRISVNDGRVAEAVHSAIEVTLKGVGTVLFNPTARARGHHLYVLTLQGRSLFSILA